MSLMISKIRLLSIWKNLKKHRTLFFWLVWGIIMSVMCGFVLRDFQTGFTIFMGFGIFLGMTLQFVKSKWLRRLVVFLNVLVAVNMIWKPLISSVQSILNQKISRSFLVDDVRQLASMLESTHPDHYTRGGGKIAFHRRMQNLIRTIPQEGLTKTEFYRQYNIYEKHVNIKEKYQQLLLSCQIRGITTMRIHNRKPQFNKTLHRQ